MLRIEIFSVSSGTPATRQLMPRTIDLDRRLQLDGAVALAAHHVVDVVRALGSERAQQETIVVSLVQQDVDLRFDNAHMRVNLVFSRLVR